MSDEVAPIREQERLELIIGILQEAVDYGLKYGRCATASRKKARRHWVDTVGMLNPPDKLQLAAFDLGFRLGKDELKKKKKRAEAQNSRPGDSWPLVKWHPVVEATIDREQTNE